MPPNDIIEGLPSKARGKYQKRKLLTEEQKAKILRARNRDNARRTRKRKKLYVNFIDKALKALETALGVSTQPTQSVKIDDDGRSEVDNEEASRESNDCKPKSDSSCCDTQEFNAEGGDATKNNSNSLSLGAVDEAQSKNYQPSSPSVSLSERMKGLQQNLSINSNGALNTERSSDNLLHCPHLTELSEVTHTVERAKIKPVLSASDLVAGFPNKSLLAKRLRYMKAFLQLRHCSPSDMSIKCSDEDATKKLTEWLTVCAAEVVHVTPLPAYRNLKDLEQISSCPPDCKYECRGIDAVSMDSLRIAEYFDTLMGAHKNSNNGFIFSSSGVEIDQSSIKCDKDKAVETDQRCWIASFAIDYDQATLCTEENALNMSYILTVQVADKQPIPAFSSTSASTSTSSSGSSSSSTYYPRTDIIIPDVIPDVIPDSRDYSSPLPAATPVIVSSDTSPNATPVDSCSDPDRGYGMLHECSKDDNDHDNGIEYGYDHCDDSRGVGEEGDDDICRWLEMALDTAYLHHPGYHKRSSKGVSESKMERDEPVHTLYETSQDESDLDCPELSYSHDRSIKRRKYNSSKCEDTVCYATDSGVTAGEVLFRLKVKAHVEFGDCGSDSDGRILRIVEHFSESCGSVVAPIC